MTLPTEMTVGVEEEYLLVDGEGVPAARSSQVLKAAGRRPPVPDADLQHELLEVQVEVATPVCSELGDVATHLAELRRAIASAAAGEGCLVAAVGAAPLAPDDDRVPVTDKPRYREMLHQAQVLVEEQLINGMHVHVAVPDRTVGVRVVAGVRPWLPVVLALSANSPLWRGRDSGFNSFRGVHWGRWPVEGPTPVFASAQEYDARVEALLATGAIRDRGQLYWHARLSEHAPTVEIRIADVQLDVESAVLVAGLVRGLALAALWTPQVPPPAEQAPVELLRAATWVAARHGLDADLVDPRSGRPEPAADVVGALLEHAGPALDELGDRPLVQERTERVLTEGNGATRQRRVLAEGGVDALLELLTRPPGLR